MKNQMRHTATTGNFACRVALPQWWWQLNWACLHYEPVATTLAEASLFYLFVSGSFAQVLQGSFGEATGAMAHWDMVRG